MMTNKTIMILGAGQIGEACAIRALREKPASIIIHCLTEVESKQVISRISNIAGKNSKTKLVSSWGNALVTSNLMRVSEANLHSNKKNRSELIDYYYSYLNEDLIQKSSLYSLVKKWKPNIIFDGINTATVVGYQEDPYSLPRKILKNKKQNWEDATNNLLVSNITPILIRFTQALKQSMSDFRVESYIKISTTGLGGMGNNLFYTHGDVNEAGMSSGILGKVAAAGLLHQLFLSLSHTPGFNIKVIVPAALVGWQGVNFGKFRSHGRTLPLVDSKKRMKLIDDDFFKKSTCHKINKEMKMPYVDSGENCAYSLAEMTSITAVGQMECVTREEVAEAAIKAAYGSTKHDILTAMDLSALGPSHLAAAQRSVILEKLSRLEDEMLIPSIATNNLGPTVSKHLFELFLIMEAAGKSLTKAISTKSTDLCEKIEQFIMDDQTIRSQIISLGLPILFNNKEIIVGEYYFLPNPNETNIINEKNVDLWASCGWVDLRLQEIKFWQSLLKKIQKEISLLEKNDLVILDRNWQKAKEGNIGELLAFAYSIQGGERKTI